MLICPKCGRKNADLLFLDAFCIDCYPLRLEIPSEVAVPLCRDCGRMKIGMGWKLPEKEEIERYVIRKCKGEFEKAEYDAMQGEARFWVRKSSGLQAFTRPIPFIRNPTLCPDCSRKHGGYYQAIIQFRGPSERIERYTKWAEEQINKKSFVSKIERNKDGIDVYTGSLDAAVEFLKKLDVRYTLTRKLVGQKAGKRIYRCTLAVRFDSQKAAGA